MSSWVDSGLDAASRTVAPPARSVRTKTAVSAVTCRQAATVSPANGCPAVKRSRRAARRGIIRSEYSIRPSPTSASPGTGRNRREPARGGEGSPPRGAAAVFMTGGS